MDKLKALREQMKLKSVDAFIISGADDHQSEYVTGYWRGREWLSGFDGSAGLVAVTADEAALWTDGRYFLQAERQLPPGISLMKRDELGVPDYTEWLAKNLPDGGVLGFDGRTVSINEFQKIEKALKRKNIKYSYEDDLLDKIWQGRPSLSNGIPAFKHELRYAGKTAEEKLREARGLMPAKNASAYLVAAPDSIAWLFNIRGRDIPNTPVVYSYALITEDAAHLFAPVGKIPFDGAFTLHPYENIFDFLKNLQPGTVLLYDPNAVNIKLFNSIPDACVKEPDANDIITALKAVKNPVEIKNTKNAHIKEGVVMARFLKWLSETKDTITETDIHTRLTELRKQQDGYIEPSFDTIAAYMANAANAHYSPKPNDCAEIKREGFLLVDTGAQYLDGTTDITRTIAMGALTDEMKNDFTLTLKGHIALATAVFTKGTAGGHLDAIARAPLWRAGINFRHGTGHGLGFCLSVHEGPHSVSPRALGAKLEAGMLVTDEPGVYRDGLYGIRIENVLLVEERFINEFGTFMGFETISFCPIDLRAVNFDLLTSEEKDWLEGYHRKVYETLAPYLSIEEREFLKTQTVPAQSFTHPFRGHTPLKTN